MKIILPLTVLLILLILFVLYGNLKFPLIIFFSVVVTEPVGACWRCGLPTPISASRRCWASWH